MKDRLATALGHVIGLAIVVVLVVLVVGLVLWVRSFR